MPNSEEKQQSQVVVGEVTDSAPVVQGLEALGAPEQLLAKIGQYEKVRNVIVEYIDRNFELGVDYGATDDRNPKPTLKKPGAEKICRLFNTSPEWHSDDDTWRMLGEPAGVVCYKCYIKDNATGRIIGEGRGAEKVGNKSRDANKAIKNAEKCALVDACLYTFMLSEKFTQDGGAATALGELKRQLMEDVSEYRQGTNSDKTDLVWLRGVLTHELNKSQIVTTREHAHIRKVIFEENKFDKLTGEVKK